jgi:hypothetical protein
MPHSARWAPFSRQPVSYHVERRGSADPLQQIHTGLKERLGGTSEDRIDRPTADTGREELLAELHDITPGDAVADRERRERPLKPGSERAPGDLGGHLDTPASPTARAARALAAMLDHLDLDRRQLLDLVAHRLAHRDALVLDEHVPALAAGRPVFDDLVDRPRR